MNVMQNSINVFYSTKNNNYNNKNVSHNSINVIHSTNNYNRTNKNIL